MLTLRCTAKTLKRFGLHPDDDPPASTGRLGDWYANLLNIGPRRYVLCVSECTLLPVVVPARKAEFPDQLAGHLDRMLRVLEIPEDLARQEAEAAAEVTIARTASRRVLGVMNEMIASTAYYPIPDEPLVVALRLSQTIYGLLDYKRPARVTRGLFGLEGDRPPRPSVHAVHLQGNETPMTVKLPEQADGPVGLRLKLTLVDSDPPIWREIWVDERTTLSDLHRVFQITMGWFDHHLFEFEIGGARYEDPDPEAEGKNAKRTTLAGLRFRAGDVFHYTYDFGDSWRCEIRVEERRQLSRLAWLPHLEAGERAGPPEDAGGIGGLEELLEALADPAHPEHESYRTWAGEHYDPARLDIRACNGFLGLAVGWGAIGPRG